MKSAHVGVDITHAEFNALVGDPVTTLKKCKVGERRQFELLSVLSPMGQDIVERQYSPSKKEVRMTMRTVGMSVVLMVSILIILGGNTYSDDAVPMPPVPADYADKHMPAGGWTDAKAIAEGAKIFTGEANPLVNCASCHGKDGQPVKKGARDLRDPKNTTRFSDSFWFWRVSEGVPKTKMKAWKQFLSEEQIWQVMAYEHQFSHGNKPAEHTDYKP